MESDNLDYIYAKLMSPIQNTLLTEMLVLGLFFVLFSYVRAILREPKIIKSRNFRIRLILLVDIVLLNVYMITSYFLDYSNVSLQELIENAQALLSNEYLRAKLMFFAMVPLDIGTLAIHVSMYATISMTDDFKTSNTEFIKDDIRKTMKNLFFIGILFHAISVFWWLFFGIFTRTGFHQQDIGFHLFYSMVYLLGYLICKIKHYKFVKDWGLLAYYSIAMLSVYVFRTITFMDRLLLE